MYYCYHSHPIVVDDDDDASLLQLHSLAVMIGVGSQRTLSRGGVCVDGMGGWTGDEEKDWAGEMGIAPSVKVLLSNLDNST